MKFPNSRKRDGPTEYDQRWTMPDDKYWPDKTQNLFFQNFENGHRLYLHLETIQAMPFKLAQLRIYVIFISIICNCTLKNEQNMKIYKG